MTEDLIAEIEATKCPFSGHYELEEDHIAKIRQAIDGARRFDALMKRLQSAEISRYRDLLIKAGRWVPMPDDSCQCEDCVEQAESVAAIVAAGKEASQ